MGSKAYPACIFFCVVIAASVIAMGRVELRAGHLVRPWPCSIEKLLRSIGNGPSVKVPFVRLPSAEGKLRPSGLTPPLFRASESSLAMEKPRPAATVTLQAPARSGAGANISLPVAFEPAGETTGHAAQYVGQGKGMTVLLESDGIEINIGSNPRGPTSARSLKLRLLNRAAEEGVTTTKMLDGHDPAPTTHRKKRSGAASAPRTHKRRKKRSMPRKDTPGHAGQVPHAQRAPKQRTPRQPKPTALQENSRRKHENREANFAWQGLTMLGGETNYFLGNDPARWRTHVKHFAEAAATSVLPGVDMVAYGNAEGVEYDLRVAPGVNTRDLRLEIAHAGGARSEAIRLVGSGDLIMALDGHEMRMQKPAIYEEWAATESQPVRRKRIGGGYQITADGSVAFEVGPHDPAATLVIDPSLTVAYTTFLGGAGNDTAQSIALDSAGYVYIGGTTTSAETFTESSTKRVGPSGGSDFFIAKINPLLTGPSSLVYLTFIGGSGAELGGEIAVDASGNVAIAGTSTSVDYPVTDASTLTLGADGTAVNDAAVTEIDPTGAKLVYSTLFGGNADEATLSSGGIAMDSAGDIYLAMDTQSTNLTVAPAASTTSLGPYSSVFGGGGMDGFLAIFRPVVTGTTPHLEYCTYLGIDALTVTLTGVAVDSVGNAYLAGYLSDPTGTLPTANGFQTLYGGDPYDGFVMKILPSGNGPADLSYATFLGGSGMDQALAIAVGTQLPGTAYVTGTTQSTNFPVTGTVFGPIAGYQPSLNGKANAFLAVIGQNGAGVTSLLYSSYLGGENTDVGLGVWFAQTNQVYVSGSTTSPNFPAQENFQPFSGDQDAFVTELDPTSPGGESLIFSTPLGGTSVAGVSATTLANGIAAAQGKVYVTGATTASNFPLAGNPNTGAQLTCASCQQTPPLNDAFLVEITPSATALPSVSLNTGKVNFGIQPVGTLTIPPQAVAVKNTGDAPLNISSITLAGANSADFSLQNPNACMTAPIPPGSMCSFEVGFVPSLVGPEGAFVNFADDAPNGSQVLEVVGTGGGPLAIVSPLSINFGSQPEGTTSSSAQIITLTNGGNQPLTVTGVILPAGPTAGEFPPASPTTACALVVLAPGASCAIAIDFAPQTTGAISTEVGFVDNSSFLTGSEQVVSVTGTGTGVAPILTVSPAALSFGTQSVGVMSGTQTVTLLNAGSSLLNLTGIAITGSDSTNFGFYVKGATPCPLPSGTLIAGASCTISVDFDPQADGPVGATLSISDNAAGSPQTVALTGTGGTAGISFSPTSLTFAVQTVGAASPAQTVTVTNTGSSAVVFNRITPAGADPNDFLESDNCFGGSVGAGKTCVISATFDPLQAGSRVAVLQITDSATASTQTIALNGQAVQAAATITPSPTINFGSALAGTASTPVTVTIANSGTAPAILNVGVPSVTPAGNFTATNHCSAGIPAAGSCTLTVTFTPPAVPAAAPCGSTVGPKSATLTITDNAPTSPQSIALSGTTTDFCPSPSGVTSQTVTAGSPATYQLTIGSSQGFAGAVALTCSDLASLSACTVQPATANLTAGAQVPFVLNVTTTAIGATPGGKAPDSRRNGPIASVLRSWTLRGIVLWAVLLVLVAIVLASVAKRELSHAMRFAQTSAIMVLLSIGLAACFGNGTAAVAPAGTPAGSYTMTVTGTFTGTGGSTTRSVEVTLVVQ